MANFNDILYESVIYSFGKILAEYNVFAQNTILKNVGGEILNYLKINGFNFKETGTIGDVLNIMKFFEKQGFADLESLPFEKGIKFKWTNLYGFNAYSELQDFAENPFLSCPLNACLCYLADKQGKRLNLIDKTFNLEEQSVISTEELIDKPEMENEGFDPLIIENRRLIKLAENKNKQLEKSLEEIKRLQGMLPICSRCKKIRDEKGYWNEIESYIMENSDAIFTHGICEQCAQDLYGEDINLNN
jgi:hypothetical protein